MKVIIYDYCEPVHFYYIRIKYTAVLYPQSDVQTGGVVKLLREDVPPKTQWQTALWLVSVVSTQTEIALWHVVRIVPDIYVEFACE